MTSLVKKLEQNLANANKAGAFVVVLAEDADKIEGQLKQLAEKENLKKVILTIDSPAGPPSYKISKDADVTVLLYDKKKVVKNFAFEKGKFSEKDAESVAAAFQELLSAQK